MFNGTIEVYRKEHIDNLYRTVASLNNLFSSLLHPSMGADINYEEAVLFLYVGKTGSQNMKSISAYLDLPLSTANSVVSNLVKKGIVVRTILESDRRVVWVSLTQEWQGKHEKYVKDQAAIARKIYRLLGYRDIQAVFRIQKKLHKMVGKPDGEVNAS